MTRKRTIATLAALGGLTATVALLSGMPAALADELSDLRANQELLQQRLDQLAQGVPYGGVAHPTGGPGVGVAMAGGSFPRSFLIPGTDTSLRVGGEIRENILYFFNGANPNAQPQTTNVGATGQVEGLPLNIKVPVPAVAAGGGGAPGAARARSTDNFDQSAQQSKLNFETRTPTAWGEARSFVEFDFAGGVLSGHQTFISDSLIPRLRYAYGTLGGVLAGQANSNFADPDAAQETLDFGGNMGDPGIVRVPQVRYTMPLAPWGFLGTFSVSAETTGADAWTPATGIIGSDTAIVGVGGIGSGAPSNPLKLGAPPVTAAWYIPQPWGHVDFSTVVRPAMQFKDGFFVDRSFTGYGFNFSGDVKPHWFGWEKDDITWHAVYGVGIGSYLNATSNAALVSNYPAGAPPASATAAASVLISPNTAWGGNVGYQHFWLPNLRSTLSGGVNFQDIHNLGNTTFGFVCGGATVPSTVAGATQPARFTGSGGCGLNKELITAHINLIWNPVSFVDVGVEYMWGHRVTLSNLKGDENVLLSRFRVQF